MDEGNNHHGCGEKEKKSNLSINHKLKTYHLESSQSSSNSSQILDDSSSSSDLDECNSLNISSSPKQCNPIYCMKVLQIMSLVHKWKVQAFANISKQFMNVTMYMYLRNQLLS